MKQFDPTRRSFNVPKIFACLLLALLVAFVAPAQTYKAQLSGANEQPPNASTGTGNATVTISGTSMMVEVSFSGLVSPSTNSHIHAPTATAGTGTAGVATVTPSFTGFPSGVTAGTYSHTFDMTLAGSYNPAFLSANGGVPLQAFAALKAAMDAGKSYLNIHSLAFPGGEIRGFLVTCPVINVTIPDAFALPQGVLPNTVYPDYAPASSLTLTSNVSGGTGPYSYNWSNGATTASTTVSPTTATTYTLKVKDANGCPGSASKTVNVMDVSGGRKDNKVLVCHMGNNTLTVASPAVAAHLGHGDMLGACTSTGATTATGATQRMALATEVATTAAKVLPNPTRNYFDIQLGGLNSGEINVKVFDFVGRVVDVRRLSSEGGTLRIGAAYRSGIYLVEISQGAQKQVLKLVKEN